MTLLQPQGIDGFTGTLGPVLAAAAIQGLASGILVSAGLPAIEWGFRVATDIRLVELANQNHPLMREMILRAPGTHNHSMLGAILAETAADSIGANGLLCRAGAYFHDIGKMHRPGYFTENAGGSIGLHEGLSPAMSALIITAHPKDSLELAERHNLPPKIRDFMTQHHGTALVEYFYRKALAEARDGESVNEDTFRHIGPKPQDRENAIVNVADSVEAAARSLDNPTFQRLDSLVQNLVYKKMADGQFDECPITVAELEAIRHAMVRVLVGTHASRVKYPEMRA
jgi:putative nucleotidyltransferase with HDIG domain